MGDFLPSIVHIFIAGTCCLYNQREDKAILNLCPSNGKKTKGIKSRWLIEKLMFFYDLLSLPFHETWFLPSAGFHVAPYFPKGTLHLSLQNLPPPF